MLLAILLTFVSPYFLTTTNLLNIGKGAAVVGILAVGETIVIIAGGFDLSVGSTMAAAGMTAGYMVNQGVPLSLAFARGSPHRPRGRPRSTASSSARRGSTR